MKQLIFWVALSTIVGCGRSSTTITTAGSAIDFSPNPSMMVSGTCSSEVSVFSTTPTHATLLTLDASFVDNAGNTATFTMSESELTGHFGVPFIPSHGVVTANFSFDLGSKGVLAPAQGTMVLIVVSDGKTFPLAGVLECQT